MAIAKELRCVNSGVCWWNAFGFKGPVHTTVSSNVLPSLLLVAMPGAPSSVLASSSDARSPSSIRVPVPVNHCPLSLYSDWVNQNSQTNT